MNDAPQVLIVDDENSVREMVSILLVREGCRVTEAASGDQAVALLEAGNRYDVVITDLAMDRGGGMLVLEQVKIRDANCPVILITAFGTTDTAVEAMKKGAHDYISKPFHVEEFKLVIRQAIDHRNLVRENIDLRARLRGERRITDVVGHSDGMRRVVALAEKVADSPASVLLSGESGTGKEVVARAIHFSSERKSAPFVPVNCGALPEQLMESELFGHVKGAFTGATGDKVGLVQSAEGGTLFLDEVGELPPPLQVKLLRMLQEKQIRRVGDTTETPVDVRIISATNRDLEALVRDELFRTDLFYRINVISIEMPPLRERMEDVKPLIESLLPQIAHDNGSSARSVHPEAMRHLLNHNFPGNVRELKNILERATALATGDVIAEADLPPSLLQKEMSIGTPGFTRLPDTGIDLENELKAVEDHFIQAALKTTGGVQSAAAKLLGISVRSLRYRMERPANEPTGEDL